MGSSVLPVARLACGASREVMLACRETHLDTGDQIAMLPAPPLVRSLRSRYLLVQVPETRRVLKAVLNTALAYS